MLSKCSTIIHFWGLDVQIKIKEQKFQVLNSQITIISSETCISHGESDVEEGKPKKTETNIKEVT